MKRNILFVVDEKRMGGVSVLFETIISLMDISNYNIDLLVLHNNGEMFKNLPSSINIIYGSSYFEAIDYTMKEIIKKKSIKLLLKKIKVVLDMKTGHIENVIKKERKKILTKKYDVEIAFKDGFTALFTAFGDSKRKIHWLHYEYKKTNPNGKYDKLFKRILPTFDKIVAVSDNVKKCFNDIYHLDDKVIVIYNVVNGEKIIELSKEESNVLLNSNELNLVSVGRLHEMKGYDRLIDTIYKLKSDGIFDNVKLRIYGDGPLFESLNQKISDLKLTNDIFLMGSVMNPYKYIKNSDLFILSSIYEPFGLVIVESLTLGVPVLATLNSATDKLISNDYNGLIVENSLDGLYSGLKKIIENKEILKKYKNNLTNYFYDNNEQLNKIKQILD